MSLSPEEREQLRKVPGCGEPVDADEMDNGKAAYHRTALLWAVDGECDACLDLLVAAVRSASRPERVDDLHEAAWGIIANVGDGDWAEESHEWREAATRWRDQYHAAVSASPPTPEPEPSEVEKMWCAAILLEGPDAIARITGRVMDLRSGVIKPWWPPAPTGDDAPALRVTVGGIGEGEPFCFDAIRNARVEWLDDNTVVILGGTITARRAYAASLRGDGYAGSGPVLRALPPLRRAPSEEAIAHARMKFWDRMPPKQEVTAQLWEAFDAAIGAAYAVDGASLTPGQPQEER